MNKIKKHKIEEPNPRVWMLQNNCELQHCPECLPFVKYCPVWSNIKLDKHKGEKLKLLYELFYNPPTKGCLRAKKEKPSSEGYGKP